MTELDAHLGSIYKADVFGRGPAVKTYLRAPFVSDPLTRAMELLKTEMTMAPSLRKQVEERLKDLKIVLEARPEDYITKKLVKYLTDALENA